MHGAGKVFWGFELALDKRLIDDHLGGNVSQLTSLSHLHLFCMGSKFRCIRSTPTEMQSMSEKDFECFARTGVNTPVTMFPDSGLVNIRFPRSRLLARRESVLAP